MGSLSPSPPPWPCTGGDEGVAPLGEDLHEVVGEVTASQVETHDGVGQGIALVDGHVVGDAIPGVQDNAWDRGEGEGGHSRVAWSLPPMVPVTNGPLLTSGAAGGVEGEHGLDGHVHGGDVEGFEHDLGGERKGAGG